MGYVLSDAGRDGLRLRRSPKRRLKRPLVGRRWAWAGFALVAVGAVMAMVPVALGLASVLYTFYPPMIGNPFYYIGVVLVVVGSWVWVALMSVNLRDLEARQSRRAGAARRCSPMSRGRYLWGWTAVGAAIEMLFLILPVALGLTDDHRCRAGARVLLVDAARHRLFLADADLHRLLHDLSARDRRTALQRSMARISFILFLVVAMPIGMHHLFADPQVGAGFKFMHSVFTGAGLGADPADHVHDLRLGGNRRPAARRQGCVWLGHGAAVGQSDHAGDRVLVRHARASAAPAASST